MPRPSPKTVPSASVEKGLQSPLGDIAGVREKQTYMKMSLRASTPPVTTISNRRGQLLDRHPQSRKGACASRVDNAIGAAQVEAIGDAARDDVTQ